MRKIDFYSVYTFKRDGDVIIVTGFDPTQEVGVGSICVVPTKDSAKEYEVESIRRRDHRGEFKDPATAVNSYYQAKLKLKI
jgi:SOS-response transcriptional repressor LexA